MTELRNRNCAVHPISLDHALTRAIAVWIAEVTREPVSAERDQRLANLRQFAAHIAATSLTLDAA